MAAQRTYLAIDLKSFYASVECVDRHLDPLTTNLVVADASRTEKTICLAVSPSLKAYKIPGRARLFEAVQRVKEVNAQRLQTAIRQKKAVRGEDGKYHFASTSFDANALNADRQGSDLDDQRRHYDDPHAEQQPYLYRFGPKPHLEQL